MGVFSEPEYLGLLLLTPVFLGLALWARRRRTVEVASVHLWRLAARDSARQRWPEGLLQLLPAILLPVFLAAGLAGLIDSRRASSVTLVLDDSRRMALSGRYRDAVDAAQKYLREHPGAKGIWRTAGDGAELTGPEAYQRRMAAGGGGTVDGRAGQQLLRGILSAGGTAVWVSDRPSGFAAQGLTELRVGRPENNVSLSGGWRRDGQLWGVVSSFSTVPAQFRIERASGRECARGELQPGEQRVVALGINAAGASSEASTDQTYRLVLPAGVDDALAGDNVLTIERPLLCAADRVKWPDIARFLQIAPDCRYLDLAEHPAAAAQADLLFCDEWPQALPRRGLVLLAPREGIPGASAGRLLQADAAAVSAQARGSLPDLAARGLRDFPLTGWFLPPGAEVWIGAEAEGERWPFLAGWRADPEVAVPQVILLAALPPAWTTDAGFPVTMGWLLGNLRGGTRDLLAGDLRMADSVPVQAAGSSGTSSVARGRTDGIFFLAGVGCFLWLLLGDFRKLREEKD